MFKVVYDHKQVITPTITAFYFKPNSKLQYLAGQYVELKIPGEIASSIGDNRWFTLSSAPTEKLLSISTRLRQPLSEFKTHLVNMSEGEELTMSEPIGDFVLPKDPNIPLVFITGGIGITPVRSIVKWLIDTKQKRSITLFYFVRGDSEIAYKDLLNSYPMNFKTMVTGSNKINIDEELSLIKKSSSESLFFISGPEPMVEDMADKVNQKFDRSQIIMDYFPGYTSI